MNSRNKNYQVEGEKKLGETLMAYQSVSDKFEKLTGRKPARICTAPGRVNLIGEHIDYNGYSVLPCAVGRFTVVAIGVSENSSTPALRVSTADNDDSDFEVTLDEVREVDKGSHHWCNYVLASYLGLRENGVVLPRGIEIVVGGDLPRACGLSSSSSLVVACAMAMSSLRRTRQAISPEMLADICMKAEWHVGTAGGGMDQAAIILSKAGFATHIQFNPLRSAPVQLPEKVSFVVANSLARSAKAETAHKNFNKRVFECKLGQRLLRTKLGLALVDPIADTYRAVEEAIGDVDVLSECRRVLPRGPVDKATIISLLGKEVIDTLLTGRWGRNVWDLNECFLIQARAVHVFSEADRVARFIQAASAGDTDMMADCINESGRSLDEDYDCSCPELRELMTCMKKSGCVAARLVGAGFGGCAVGMVPSDQVTEVVDRIQCDYFKFFSGNKNEVCFAFEPASGARLV